MIKNDTRMLLVVILLISACGLVENSLGVARAQAAFDFSVSLNGYAITLAPNHSGFVQVTVSLVSGTPQNVTLSSSVLPQDGLLSTSFAPQSWGYPSFVATLVVSALGVIPGKQYFVTVTGVSGGLVKQAPVLTVTIGCSQGACATLTTASIGSGTVAPSCPYGCSEPIGQAVNVTAVPSPNWTFSGWNVTGTACTNGIDVNPCDFTMPNGPVSVTANFVQYQQTLYTSATGQGQVSPSCSSGCQVTIGSQISITVTAAQGWTVSGYHLTNGVSCASDAGYICSFTMPNFPVTFQVTFDETTMTTQQTVVITSTIRTTATNTAAVVSASTSTVSSTTTFISIIGMTVTSTIFSTSSSAVTQTQTNLLTQTSNVTTGATSVTMALENPLLELALACVILISLLTMGANLIRRSGHRGAALCSHCGFNNASARKYCENCGQLLKGT